MNTTKEQPQITAPQLKDLADQIRVYQVKSGLSDTALVKKFGQLPSTKTYKRILDGDFDQMDIEAQHLRFSQALAEISALESSSDQPEDDFDWLAHIETVREAVREAVRETGNNRLVIIEGQSGSGKSKTLTTLARIWPNLILTEADTTWSALSAMTIDLLLAFRPINRKPAEVQIPFNNEARKHKIIEFLKARKRILAIDEAHHMAPAGLNFLKTLINQTGVVIVIAAIPRLLKNLELAAFEECRQLSVNRLSSRVHLNGPPETEALAYMRARGVIFADEKTGKAAAKYLCAGASVNWNFVNLVSRFARREAAGQPLDLDQFVKAQNHAAATR